MHHIILDTKHYHEDELTVVAEVAVSSEESLNLLITCQQPDKREMQLNIDCHYFLGLETTIRTGDLYRNYKGLTLSINCQTSGQFNEIVTKTLNLDLIVTAVDLPLKFYFELNEMVKASMSNYDSIVRQFDKSKDVEKPRVLSGVFNKKAEVPQQKRGFLSLIKL
ncbi:hypothetical protein JCM19233_1944 [Vibrio astriarenae]|nr:hypothetical protein JCM19233_1944 [Vibrio sp. C7]